VRKAGSRKRGAPTAHAYNDSMAKGGAPPPPPPPPCCWCWFIVSTNLSATTGAASKEACASGPSLSIQPPTSHQSTNQSSRTFGTSKPYQADHLGLSRFQIGQKIGQDNTRNRMTENFAHGCRPKSASTQRPGWIPLDASQR